MIEHAASIVFSQGRGSIMNDDEMESSQWDYVAAPPKPAFMIHYRGSETPPAARDGRLSTLQISIPFTDEMAGEESSTPGVELLEWKALSRGGTSPDPPGLIPRKANHVKYSSCQRGVETNGEEKLPTVDNIVLYMALKIHAPSCAHLGISPQTPTRGRNIALHNAPQVDRHGTLRSKSHRFPVPCSLPGRQPQTTTSGVSCRNRHRIWAVHETL
ncbi:unnamed protein product [Fusarium graminearum]|uniref:Uncharacterized protein n=1 Tax=Gibberella zeae TaxID=5518 RepID=A0A4U9ENT2_GIBZA|nr:unnamed protein product [Fusarium graminearum]CAF3536026.1 unnamed protein product [Fusarium graminearum]CAF3650247.1 unnamed protein product [Fusarium graminearum]CAG1968062.1 unnamed protein product [Fusarium graminearum]VTO82159.1 unnamed protein product [Fusarium graminearum]